MKQAAMVLYGILLIAILFFGTAFLVGAWAKVMVEAFGWVH